MRRSFKALLGCIIFLCLVHPRAQAAVFAIPPGQDLEAQAERFRQEYSMEKQIREKHKEKPSVEFEEKEEKPVGPEVSFVLNEVRLSGMTAFDPDKFKFIWEPALGRKITNKDLSVIANNIKRVYKDLGFLTTLTYVPPQDIKDGVVEIHVVEGKRGSLNVDGNKWFSTASVAKYVHIYRGEPLDMGELQKDVMRLNDNRDLKVSAILAPGKEQESVDVTLKAQEVMPYHVTVGTDNQGSRLTGRYRKSIALNTSNLSGNRDELSLNAVITALSSGEFVSYQTPVGTYGTKLGMDIGFFEAKLGREYLAYDITTATQSYNPNLTFELYQSQDLQADLRTGVKIKNVEKKQARDKLTNERLRQPYAAVDVTESDATGQTHFSPEIGYGAAGQLGASRGDNPLASRPGADKSFVKYSHVISREQRMPLNSYMMIRSQFQTATHSLPISEQFQLGGVNSIRGYPEGDYLADVAANLNMDWYFHPLPSSWRLAGFNFKEQVEPLVFLDVGKGWLLDTYNGEQREKYLAGTGAGVRVRVRNNAYLKMEWAKPVGDKPIHGTGPSTFDMSFQCGF